MRAEIQGKLDPESDLPVTRLEDALTDAVFSAVRYLPRRSVLGALLRLVLPGAVVTPEELDAAEFTFWPTLNAVLWPGREVEPDVVLVVGDHVVVFEAKYQSGFQHRDLDGVPVHQLAMEWCAAVLWARARKASSVTVVAVTADAVQPGDLDDARRQVDGLASRVGATAHDHSFQWLSWHALAQLFRDVQGLAPHEEAVREDVLAFLDHRGVSHVFQGFDAADYELVARAQRTAAERLYPAISTFVQELTSLLDGDGIEWGAPFRGMWATSGLGWQNPADWTRDFLAAPYWPASWPRRRGNNYVALYVLFDFIDPAVEVGYVQASRSVAEVADKWSSHYPDLADQLRALDDDLEVAVHMGNWTSPGARAGVRDVDRDWLVSRGPYRHLRLRRRLPVADVTGPEPVHDAVRDLRAAVEACPALFAMLRDSEQLEQPPAPGEDISTASSS